MELPALIINMYDCEFYWILYTFVHIITRFFAYDALATSKD